ncbi:hypothetical protein SAMN00120144_2482 [Hymenobacter roseosalivarius DSM 11622]|uniref:Uncharacterized protein n=1 Tax=Hymenobacter roseosalivarius DSM 11622 TaxID=645990 RepID=A0A1W1VEQ1_9BACT|nr:hypothetical protein [Hymenobacter roseosalivarius]SMB91889.1 hypothetical protein SAMN00120144_2482 [Hymenobacter roseosalivarius DSM 11622]
MVGSTHYLDQQNGFREVRFGQKVNELSRLVLVSVLHDPRVSTYAREVDELLYLSYPLRQIHYRFFDEQLYRIDLLATGAEVIAGLRQEFIRLYGLPTSGPLGEEWVGQQVTASIVSFRTRTENAYFTLSSQSLLASATAYVYRRGLMVSTASEESKRGLGGLLVH